MHICLGVGVYSQCIAIFDITLTGAQAVNRTYARKTKCPPWKLEISPQEEICPRFTQCPTVTVYIVFHVTPVEIILPPVKSPCHLNWKSDRGGLVSLDDGRAFFITKTTARTHIIP